MKKNAYVSPETDILLIETQQLMDVSRMGVNEETVESTNDLLSRPDSWDDED